jgi:hypothetical protein
MIHELVERRNELGAAQRAELAVLLDDSETTESREERT